MQYGNKFKDIPQKTLDLPIDNLKLPTRAKKGLDTLNIKTISQLLQKNESDLLKLRNIGRKTLNDIIESLKELGIETDFKDY